MEEDNSKKRPKQSTKFQRVTSKNDSESSSGEGEEEEDSNVGSDGETLTASKGVRNITVPAAQTRERISRSSKVEAQHRISKIVADENTLNEKQPSTLCEFEKQEC